MQVAAIVFSIYMLINLFMAIMVDRAWVREGFGDVNRHGVHRNKLFATMIFFGVIVGVISLFMPREED